MNGSASSATSPQSVLVRAPATTANLGPGFDCLGLALDLWNDIRFSLKGAGITVEVDGEGAETLPTGAENLIASSALRLYDDVGEPRPEGLLITCRTRVPLASGLGSSSSAIVAGLLGANALLGAGCDRNRLLRLVADIEGHPDNVAAALLGGLVIVVQKDDGLLTRRIMLPELHVALAVPALSFSTRASRAGLPLDVPLRDAVYNLGRAPLVVEALRTGDFDLLGAVMDDRLHQTARLKLIPGGKAAWVAAHKAGAAAVALSGSGPSVIAFVSLMADARGVAQAMVDAFAAEGVAARPLVLSASVDGASVV